MPTLIHLPSSEYFFIVKEFLFPVFPQFGGQEPGSAQEVETWAREKYGASWNFMDKVRLFNEESS